MSNAPEYGQGEGTLSRAATMVNDAQGDFNRISKKLEGQIDEVRGKWAGAGANAFQILHQAWQEKQGIIVKALADFENALTETEKDNVSTDDAQHTSYSNLTNRLG